MPVSVTLQQEKTVFGDQYRVASRILAATPDDLYGAFLVQYGLNRWDEFFLRAATLDDVARYLENPLNDFRQAGLNPVSSGIYTDCILTISPAPTEWFDHAFSTAVFTVIDVDATRMVVTPDFPRAGNELHWAVTEPDLTPVAAGTAGEASARDDAPSTPFLRRHWVGLYDLVTAAEAHALAVDTGVRSLAVGAHDTPPPFVGLETVVYP